MNVLLTGGAGYIGSHTAIELFAVGHDVVIVDNLVNSSVEAVRRVEELADRSVVFYEADVRDRAALETIFTEQAIDAVIHFAGLKAVGESTAEPLRYYRTNIDSTLTLLETMAAHDVHKLVFSSSATVYGDQDIPYVETQPTGGPTITNPYGRTKYMVEEIIKDVSAANGAAEFTLLRYFNPVGAHPSGRIGEHPRGVPNNLMPFVAQVAAGMREKLAVFGDDYPTVDGTGVRDYIHVVDLARGHVAALEHSVPGVSVYNLGSGCGTSVLEVLKAFEQASGVPIGYVIESRRPGDLAEYYANPAKADRDLNWRTELSVADACRDTWRWQSANPNGYDPA